MTVTNTTEISPVYAGNGSTTAFATGFQFLQNADVQVVTIDASGNETVKTLGTDYTLTGAGSSGGGTVTFGVAPAVGTSVQARRAMTFDQQTVYTDGQAFPAASHMTALDKLTMLSQQVDAKLNRAPLLKASSSNYPQVFPDGGSANKGYLVGWDNSTGTTLSLYNPASLALTTGVVPYGTSLTLNQTGQVGIDTNGDTTNITQGLFEYFDGARVMYTCAVDAIPTVNNSVLTYNSGSKKLTFSTVAGGIASVSADVTPSLGGDLSVAGHLITSTSNGDVKIQPNGTGNIVLGGGTSVPTVKFMEPSGTGSTYVALKAPSSITSSVTWTLPNVDSTGTQYLSSNGSGTLSWGTPAGSGGALTYLGTATASNSASITFTSIVNTYDSLLIIFDGIVPATNAANLQLLLSTDNSTYLGGTGYSYSGWYNTGGTITSLRSMGTNNCPMCAGGIYNSSTIGGSGHIYMHNYASASKGKVIVQSSCYEVSSAVIDTETIGYTHTTTSAIQAIKFQMTSGNITSGTFRLYGITTS